jgi:NAD(P)-dependent dehydrogenase (short-subunit alcohol dehydrogenase family)
MDLSGFARHPGLKGKTVFITGGGSGIGAAIVESFLDQEAKTAFVDIDERASEKLVQELKRQYGRAPLFIPCDIKDVEALQAAIGLRVRVGCLDIRDGLSAKPRKADEWVIGQHGRRSAGSVAKVGEDRLASSNRIGAAMFARSNSQKPFATLSTKSGHSPAQHQAVWKVAPSGAVLSRRRRWPPLRDLQRTSRPPSLPPANMKSIM